MSETKFYGYSTEENNYSDKGGDYAVNRCRICDRELQDPVQLYGEWCARKYGLDPYGGLVKQRISTDYEVAQINYNDSKEKENVDRKVFEEYNNLILEEPQKAQEIMYNSNTYAKDELNKFIREYVYQQGGMKKGNSNVYQVIYTAPITNDEKITNSRNMKRGSWDFVHTNPNMYDNYQFNIFDAINWLIQTGGNGNFVLQTRATEDWWEAAKAQNELVRSFVYATHFLQDAGVLSNELKPRLYIGSTEKNGVSGKWIYECIEGQKWVRDSGVIAGIYYGCEDVNEDNHYDNARDMAEFAFNNGKQLLWIPYYDNSEKLEKIKNNIEETHTFVDSNNIKRTIPLFNTVIIQPGTFYGKNREANIDDVMKLVRRYNNGYNKTMSQVGIELEFDMGLVTGRRDGTEKMSIKDKRVALNKYLNALTRIKDDYSYKITVPIGVYSGGPNEQGYRNIRANINTHNNGNHIPYIGEEYTPKEDWYSTGVNYNHFPDAYQGGNLIYDINDYIYNDIWKDSLEKSMWLTNPNKMY